MVESSVRKGFGLVVEFYTLPADAGFTVRVRLAATWAMFGASKSLLVISWATWLLTYIEMMYPGTVPVSTGYVRKEFPDGFLRQVEEVFDTTKSLAKAAAWGKGGNLVSADKQDEVDAVSVDEVPMRGFSRGVEPVHPHGSLAASTQTEALFGHFGLVVYLASKTVTDTNRIAITERRPAAIERAHLLGRVPILTGARKLSAEAHTYIRAAWDFVPEVRFSAMQRFSGLRVSGASREDTAFTNVFALMKFSGMSHAGLIHRFLVACPWSIEIGQLRPSIASYAASARAFEDIDPSFMPYYKIAMGSKTDLFKRSDMAPLVACALHVEALLTPTLKGFYADPAQDGVVRMFEGYRKQRNIDDDALRLAISRAQVKSIEAS